MDDEQVPAYADIYGPSSSSAPLPTTADTVSFPVQTDKIPQLTGRNFNTFITVNRSITLPELYQEAHTALAAEHASILSQHILNNLAVATLTVHWQGSLPKGKFPEKTDITKRNIGAVLSYLSAARGYDVIDVVLIDKRAGRSSLTPR